MTTTWMVRCRDSGRYLDDAIAGGVITVGFADTSDASGLTVAEITGQLTVSRARLSVRSLAKMLFAFVNEIAIGDGVLSCDSRRRQVVVGRVTGPYEWVDVPAVHLDRHIRRLSWTARCEWDDLPQPVKSTVLHNRRMVWRFEDQVSASACIEQAEASGRHAVFRARTAHRQNVSIDQRLEGANRGERRCMSCFVIRPRVEFTGDSQVCHVCE